MANLLQYVLAILALCAAPFTFENGLVHSLQAEPTTSGPELPSGSQRPSGRQRLTRAWQTVSKPIRQALNSLQRTFFRRSRRESAAELQTMETATAKYLQCLSFGPAKDLAVKAIQSVCAEQRNEAVERTCLLFAAIIEGRITGAKKCLIHENLEETFACLRRNHLFLVHPLLHEKIAVASEKDFDEAESWLSSLEFKSTFTPTRMPFGSPLTQAFAKLNWSSMGSVDNQHKLAAAFLKRSTVASRSLKAMGRALWARFRRRPPSAPTQRVADAEKLVDQGTSAFLNMPPRPDPLAVRLAVTILLRGASCPKNNNFKSTERVMVNGKARSVKAKKMLEAATLVAVKHLFDASDCAGRNANPADSTCKLLHAYDVYMQAGGSLKAFADEAQRVDIPESLTLPEGSEEAGESDGNIGSPGADTEDKSPIEVSDSGQPSTAFFENTDFSGQGQGETLHTGKSETSGDEENDSTSSGTSAPSEPSEDEGIATQPTEAPESPGRNERILTYAQNASASALAIARLSLMSGSVRLRLVSFLLRSSFFLRHATRLLLAFLGDEILSKQGAALLRADRARSNFLIGLQIRALVKLATGNNNLGRLVAAVASEVAEEESRRVREEEQPASFLQDELSPKHVENVLKEADIPFSKHTPRRIAIGLTAGFELLAAALLLSLSLTLSPLAVAIAVILVVVVAVKTMIAVVGQAVMEARGGPIQQVAEPIRGLYKELKRSKW